MSNKAKSRLGRGLSSLISVSESVEERVESPLPIMREIPVSVETSEPQPTKSEPTNGTLPIDLIDANPHQPRRTFNDTLLSQLASSLKMTGLIQPIIVRRVDDRYELIAGERRLRAAKLAGLTEIPAIVREVDSFAQAQMALVENIQREDLNPMERASAYKTLLDQLGLTQAELAQRLGEERSSIANYLRLNELGEACKSMVRHGQLSFGHAKLLAGVSDILEQVRLANLVISEELSVRSLERIIAEPPEGEEQVITKPAASPTAYISDLEKSISRQLGMRVQVRNGNKGKGKLIIHYASLDQFDQIVSKMGLELE